MTFWTQIRSWWTRVLPVNLRHGQVGESAAAAFLKKSGLKLLTTNFKGRHGEIDLICRDGDCLVFVEVKARSSELWTRPAAAVNAKKRKRISRTALEYLARIGQPEIVIRFDIVEVLLEAGAAGEIRHLRNCFTLTPPFLYV